MSKKIIVLILNTKEVEWFYQGISWIKNAFTKDEIIETFDSEGKLSERIKHYKRLGLTDDRIRILREIPINPTGFWND